MLPPDFLIDLSEKLLYNIIWKCRTHIGLKWTGGDYVGNKLLLSGEILPCMNSEESIRVRRWATKVLREYIIKGFVLNDGLMKNGWPFGKDYFDELLERIREIRASERRAYQKIADIFEQCSCDYDKNSETTRTYYTVIWKNFLPESGKTENDRNLTIFSKMIDFAENTTENGEIMRMKNWLDILNGCIGR